MNMKVAIFVDTMTIIHKLVAKFIGVLQVISFSNSVIQMNCTDIAFLTKNNTKFQIMLPKAIMVFISEWRTGMDMRISEKMTVQHICSIMMLDLAIGN